MYESPRMEMVKMEVSDMMACSVNAGGDVNISYGGNASDHDRRIRIKTEDGIFGKSFMK